MCVGAHEWPIVYRVQTGRCGTIEAPGPWLGIVPELFDVARMCAVIERAMAEGKLLDAVTRAVFDDVEAFSRRHDDDWTLLLAKRG